MKKVSIIGTVGIPACYGGFESLVENLTKYSSDDVNYQVFCSSKSYSEKIPEYNSAELVYLPLSANGVQSVPYDILSMIRCLSIRPDVVLLLGVSGCMFLPIYRLFSRSKVVTNIDGLEWKRDKWGKIARKFLKLSEAIAVKYSDIIIADNQAIGDYVSNEYGKENVIIAYGGDHVISEKVSDVDKSDYYLSLCRIEPENNVSMILEAFSQTDLKLKFVGNWDSSDFGRALKSKYKSYSNIDIIDPIYDIDELFVLRSQCVGYVHGHSAGGTNPSLVEAMHFTTPIYAFDCNFNRYSTEEKSFYFSTSRDLVKCLIENAHNEEKLNFVASSMKGIADRRYTWEIIAKQYERLY
ncbi:alpha-D-GlcNAc alpha-1,2-L-rhamnosyltransferase [Photobacterium aphoticum]|uniref:Alpha-D-GlcNAc alpha-1,2-L-rhamnosyltransferase n=1 Tax=Photobacterium aphoticum TaxID=754436 RepID=A0A090R3H3_9GAMM|nr:alpha-D-GlcNAc alpha-1,2-L-rhamnosyltransferase [Photobacterium aphoticum]